MPNIRQTYERALGRNGQGGSVWPETVPPLSAGEATRAALKLYRWARGRSFTGEVKVTSGRRYSDIRAGVMYVNPERGWRNLVHELGHDFWYRNNPDLKAHTKSHARFEANMAKQVIRRGWLDGKLKDKPKRATEPPTKERIKSDKMDAIRKRIARWETKQKRANTALRKLKRSLAAHERTL